MMYRHEDYVDALRFVAEGKIQLKPLISKHFAFRDFLSAYQYIDSQPRTYHEGGRRHSGLNLLRKGNSYGYS